MKPCNGMSVIEILVVLTLSSVILLGATTIMGRTTRTFKKGSDMLNTQVLLNSIVEQLRSDIRSLQELHECKPGSLKFTIVRGGAKLPVSYLFSNQTLIRTEEGKEKDFHGAGQVESLVFSQRLSRENTFQSLDVAMQLKSDEKGEGKSSQLSIFCQFFSKCLENPNPLWRY
ncbi:prepilin-type N-terminal cleavage/methylation domain-containing protein [bacterium]|nr:prepilin-type N-terminal cleavage/methylation domain-containing protein [bacterium]